MIFAKINLSIKTESEYTFFKHIRYPCLNSKTLPFLFLNDNIYVIASLFTINCYFCKKSYNLGRVLAIDFGKKRTGIAVTDELQIIASGLTTVNTADLLSFLKEYTTKEKVALFIMGQPKQLDNSDSESEALILPFLKKIKTLFPQIPMKRIDERFTSKMAFQTMIDSGMKKKQRRNKAMVDEISATIILQSYLYNQH
jgi:putative Holliday junction resolvase